MGWCPHHGRDRSECGCKGTMWDEIAARPIGKPWWLTRKLSKKDLERQKAKEERQQRFWNVASLCFFAFLIWYFGRHFW